MGQRTVFWISFAPAEGVDKFLSLAPTGERVWVRREGS
jgi:hypothetical protein